MKFLFFSPHADINRHAIPEAMVGEALQNEGHSISYLTCNGTFSKMCVAMSARNLNEESSNKTKKNICKVCIEKKNLILERFKFKEIPIETLLTKKTHKEAIIFTNKHKQKDPKTIYFKKVPIGCYASYEFLLNWKLNSLKFSKKLAKYYAYHLYNCYLAIEAGRTLLKKQQFDRIVSYNQNYSINNCISSIFKKAKAEAFTINSGIHKKYRSTTITIDKNIQDRYALNTSCEWQKFSKEKLNSFQSKIAEEELKECKKAKDMWVYSKPFCKKQQKLIENRLKEKTKIITVCLSSFDERFAAQMIGVLPKNKKALFTSQKKWIYYIFNLAKTLPNYYFIIRVHPREFPNKREQVTSRNLTFYQKIKINSPPNIWVNTPDEEVSLYNLIPITDLCLNLTSSSGLEYLAEQKPVLGGNQQNLFAYPPEFNYSARTKAEYKKLIVNLKRPKCSKEMIYKWIYFKTFMSAILIPDIWKNNKISIISKIKLFFLNRFAKKKTEKWILKYKILLSKIPKTFKNQKKIAEAFS